MMQSHHPITYCVPIDEVESNENYYFPAATASYSTPSFNDEILQLDQDFFDVIDALADFDNSDELFDLNPLPTVALPVSAGDCAELIPTASSYCVPRINVTGGATATAAAARVTPTATATMAPSTAKCSALKVVPAVPLCTAEECAEDGCFGDIFEYDSNGIDKKLEDLSPAQKKERRAEAVKRWKQKKHVQQHFARKRKVVSSSSQRKNIKNHDIFAADKLDRSQTVSDDIIVPHGSKAIAENSPVLTISHNQFPASLAATVDPDAKLAAPLQSSMSYPQLDHVNTQQLVPAVPSCWKLDMCGKKPCAVGGAPVSTTARIVHKGTNIPTAVSARQIATANRERERGKFKRTKTKWIPVTALYGGGL